MWLRVARATNTWTISYSTNGTTWTTGATFTWTATITTAGPYASNSQHNADPIPTFTASVDYFFDNAAPISPQDAGVAAPESDDFHTSTLNSSLWALRDPVGNSSVTVDGTHARISVPAGTAHDAWTDGNNTARLLQPATNTDFTVETKFDSQVGSAYQQQGIIVQQDDTNFLRVGTFFDGTNPVLFVAGFTNLSPTVEANTTISSSRSFWLRVARVGDNWTISYSTDGTTWTVGATFAWGMTVTGVGPFAGNSQSGSDPIPAFTAVVDSFMNTATPISPEDGAHAPYSDPFTGSLNAGVWQLRDPVGNSSVSTTGTKANITVPAGSAHDNWIEGDNTARLLQSVTNTDFTVEAKFDSQVTSAYQQQGIVVQQDDSNFLRIGTFFDGTNPVLFVAGLSNLAPTVELNTAIPVSTSVWLRVARVGNNWTISYSTDGATWTTGATFTWAMTVTGIGPFAGNSQHDSDPIPAFTAIVDSFTTFAATSTNGYDNRGNRTTNTVVSPAGTTTTNNSYDQTNRLTAIDTANAAYTYNGDGLRTTKTVGVNTNKFVWNQTGPLPQLLTETIGASTTYYLYGPDDIPYAQIASDTTTTSYLHHDQQGSIRLLTNSTGTITGAATYNPYGSLTASTGTLSHLGYTGQYTDTETGYVYLRARYYDPATAQFLTRDPTNTLTRSAYAYTDNSPLNGVDPTGLGCGLFSPDECVNALADKITGAVSTANDALDATTGSVAAYLNEHKVGILKGTSWALAAAAIIAVPLTGGASVSALPFVLALASQGTTVAAEAFDPSPGRAQRVTLAVGLALLGGAAVGGAFSVGELPAFAALTDVGLLAFDISLSNGHTISTAECVR